MSDFEEVYSIMFVSILVFFLFIIIYDIISEYQKDLDTVLNHNLVVSSSLNPVNYYYINLDKSLVIGNTTSSFTFSLPRVINNSLCRVVFYE